MAIPDLQTLPSAPLPDTLDPPSPVIIERVQPEIDAGRYPVKRVQGDILEVTADIFKDGHDKIAAVLKYRRQDEDDWREAEMRFVDNDRWAGEVFLPDNTRYRLHHRSIPRPLGDLAATRSEEVRSWAGCSAGVAGRPRHHRRGVARAPKATTARP